FVVGYTIYSLFKVFLKNLNLATTNRRFRMIQVGTAALQSYTHGTNDAQKSMGIITMALIASGFQTTDD
ncbi:inorganic phosphate transporter, partial [Escherichia coli]|nr:inorganic phosphate transporter [Escherichia coli]